jgi:two-component system, NarL family, response regulator LiaR
LTGDVPPRVLIVDDDPVVRRTLRRVLEQADIPVVGEACDGRAGARLARLHRPDVVLLDVVMPGGDGLTALAEIVATVGETTRVMMLSVHDDDATTFLALRSGAMGYVGKDVDLAVLPRLVRELHRGQAVVSRRHTARLLEQLRAMPDPGMGMRPIDSVLTSREWEVLDRLCAHQTVERIAEDFVLSVETVRTHIKNIMRKLEVHSRAEAVAAAGRMRSLPPGRAA